jgi:dUTP pyrophosphatase
MSYDAYPSIEAANKSQKMCEAKQIELLSGSSSILKVKLLSSSAHLPTKGSSGSAGYDVYASHACIVLSRNRNCIPLDIAIRVPKGTYGRIAPRSGLAWKNGIDVGAGVIDRDYGGPVGVILFNHGDSDFVVSKGDRIAQLIIEKIENSQVMQVDDLDVTERGEKGFGSTGVHSTPLESSSSK